MAESIGTTLAGRSGVSVGRPDSCLPKPSVGNLAQLALYASLAHRITNAFNLVDGLDGLAAGIGFFRDRYVARGPLFNAPFDAP